MYIRCILCLFFLFFAVVEDVQYRRIPNEVVLCGAAAGFLTCGSLYTFLWRILALLFLFCLGYFRIMGMGDLKLWMMITIFTGLRNSCFIIFQTLRCGFIQFFANLSRNTPPRSCIYNRMDLFHNLLKQDCISH